MSEAVRVRAYDWLSEQADPTVAEYVMSRLGPAPATEVATKDDVHAVKEDVREVKRDVARVDGKVDALAVRMDEKFDQIIVMREADRRAASRRAWNLALVVPVEVVVLFAGAAAVLDWLRA